jgi:hypothetical protein
VRYLLVANQAAAGHERDLEMRVMEIPGFPQKIEIPDLDKFYRAPERDRRYLAAASYPAARIHVPPKRSKGACRLATYHVEVERIRSAFHS